MSKFRLPLPEDVDADVLDQVVIRTQEDLARPPERSTLPSRRLHEDAVAFIGRTLLWVKGVARGMNRHQRRVFDRGVLFLSSSAIGTVVYGIGGVTDWIGISRWPWWWFLLLGGIGVGYVVTELFTAWIDR